MPVALCVPSSFDGVWLLFVMVDVGVVVLFVSCSVLSFKRSASVVELDVEPLSVSVVLVGWGWL